MKYEGTYVIEVSAFSTFMDEWQGYAMCATATSLKRAVAQMNKFAKEKTKLRMRFRVLDPSGIIEEECSNA